MPAFSKLYIPLQNHIVARLSLNVPVLEEGPSSFSAISRAGGLWLVQQTSIAWNALLTKSLPELFQLWSVVCFGELPPGVYNHTFSSFLHLRQHCTNASVKLKWDIKPKFTWWSLVNTSVRQEICSSNANVAWALHWKQSKFKEVPVTGECSYVLIIWMYSTCQ